MAPLVSLVPMAQRCPRSSSVDGDALAVIVAQFCFYEGLNSELILTSRQVGELAAANVDYESN